MTREETAQEIEDRSIRGDFIRAGATSKKLAVELVAIAFSRNGHYIAVTEGGEIHALPFSKIKKAELAAVKKVREHTKITESADGTTTHKDSRIEYELYDKLEALKYICKLSGLEPAVKQELGGTMVVLRPGPVNKPPNSGLSK